MARQQEQHTEQDATRTRHKLRPETTARVHLSRVSRVCCSVLCGPHPIDLCVCGVFVCYVCQLIYVAYSMLATAPLIPFARDPPKYACGVSFICCPPPLSLAAAARRCGAMRAHNTHVCPAPSPPPPTPFYTAVSHRHDACMLAFYAQSEIHV